MCKWGDISGKKTLFWSKWKKLTGFNYYRNSDFCNHRLECSMLFSVVLNTEFRRRRADRLQSTLVSVRKKRAQPRCSHVSCLRQSCSRQTRASEGKTQWRAFKCKERIYDADDSRFISTCFHCNTQRTLPHSKTDFNQILKSKNNKNK